MDDWLRVKDFPADEQGKIRWLLRHASENRIVEHGIAVRYGREWRICRSRLPEFLQRETLRTLKREAELRDTKRAALSA
jgi:hypothetical protein